MKNFASQMLWFLFVGLAVYAFWDAPIYRAETGYLALRIAIWIVFLGFFGYSVYCSLRESLFGTVRKMGKLHWGRQIGIDLYIGLLLSLVWIGWSQANPWTILIWAPALLVYGNLATLLYAAFYFDSIAMALLNQG